MVLLHGLTGDADAGHMRGTACKLIAEGFNVVRLNMRNCGGTEKLTPSLYHTGLVNDLRAVLLELGQVDGLSRIYFGGFSMGGNVALKLAGEWGASMPDFLRGVMAVSPPIELARSSEAIGSGGFHRVYELLFLRALKAMIRRKAKQCPDRYDISALPQVKSLRDFDNAYVAPAFGFDDADDYYARASAGPVLAAITLPTLVVHARDDSLVPFGPIGDWMTSKPPMVSFAISDRGGHVGFIGRRRAANSDHQDSDRFWAENRMVQFVTMLERPPAKA